MKTSLGALQKVTIRCCNIGTTLPADYVIREYSRDQFSSDEEFANFIKNGVLQVLESFDSVEIFKKPKIG